MIFAAAGARQFAQTTTKRGGEPFAIVLDDREISLAVIHEPIIGGRGQISGGFNAERAKDLALLLRAGALPAPLTVIEERSVGASLTVGATIRSL
jgi:preprotein translocase subunit SecD